MIALQTWYSVADNEDKWAVICRDCKATLDEGTVNILETTLSSKAILNQLNNKTVEFEGSHICEP